MAHLSKKRRTSSVVAYYCACTGGCDCLSCRCPCSCSDLRILWEADATTVFDNAFDSTMNYRDENYSSLRDAIHAG